MLLAKCAKCAKCIVEDCGKEIPQLLLRKIPGSFSDATRTHGLVCPAHPCKWTGLTRFDNNPVRWKKCTCKTCKQIRRRWGMCCEQCGRIPRERMYVGLLYHRKRISRDIRTLLLKALDATPYVCVWCKPPEVTALTALTASMEVINEETSIAPLVDNICVIL